MKFRNINASFDARSMKLGDKVYIHIFYFLYNQIIDFYIFILSVKKEKNTRTNVSLEVYGRMLGTREEKII